MVDQAVELVGAEIEPVVVVRPEQRLVRALPERHQRRRAVAGDRRADAGEVVRVPAVLRLQPLEEVVGRDLGAADREGRDGRG